MNSTNVQIWHPCPDNLWPMLQLLDFLLLWSQLRLVIMSEYLQYVFILCTWYIVHCTCMYVCYIVCVCYVTLILNPFYKCTKMHMHFPPILTRVTVTWFSSIIVPAQVGDYVRILTIYIHCVYIVHVCTFVCVCVSACTWYVCVFYIETKSILQMYRNAHPADIWTFISVYVFSCLVNLDNFWKMRIYGLTVSKMCPGYNSI
jgi:hypothetical protein